VTWRIYFYSSSVMGTLEKNITWQRKTLMNHPSKLLPNPLAGFMCAHVRMSISTRVAEVSGKKISATRWRTNCSDRRCVRHCVRALATPRPTLSSSSQLLRTAGLRLLRITGGGEGVGVS